MVWRAEDPQGVESRKIVWEAVPYLRGKGLDLGAGVFKVLPHVISVDNGDHEALGHVITPDIKVDTAEDLGLFASGSMDFVFSSHLLEHIVDYKSALKEWWRVVKQGGCMVLYLPHKNFYPNIGTPGANETHKHDFLPADIIDAMCSLGGWDMQECQERDEGMEYSMFLVFRKTHGSKHTYSCHEPKPEKRALVCRFGAYGDLMQASSVFAGLKQQGYHVSLIASQPGVDIVAFDPNIDKIILLDKDQVPNADLGAFWDYLRPRYEKFVNLSESVEGTWLALPNRMPSNWSPMVRHKHMNYNYLEHQHDLAGVPHVPQIKFYPSLEEKSWAVKQRGKMGRFVILWALFGSSVHKTWAGLDHVIAAVLDRYPEVDIVLTGGINRPSGENAMVKLEDGRTIHELEGGWQNTPRVHLTCGKWAMRQTCTFLEYVDLIIGPETGVLNAASCLGVPKICMLSHSSVDNLTRDWRDTVSLQSKGTRCKGRDSDDVPACHTLHYGWAKCTKNEETGTAQCQADISVDEVVQHVSRIIEQKLKRAA